MIVDLKPLPFRHARELIDWCYDNDIDRDQAFVLMNACDTYPQPDLDCTLDIPDKYMTYWILKWS